MAASLWAFNRSILVLCLVLSSASSEQDVTSLRKSGGLTLAVLSSAGDSIKAEWLHLFHTLWLEQRDEVSWCFGSTERGAYEVVQRSLPSPLPTGLPPQDVFCSNEQHIGPHLCEAEQISEYYKVLEILRNTANSR